jgi:uncharacterized protein (TIGR03437 family)
LLYSYQAGLEKYQSKIELRLVEIAPAPFFTGLNRFDNGMVRGVEVLRRVLVFRGIATTHVAACHAQPEMHPGVMHLQAFLTTVGMRLDVLNLVEMRTTHNSASHFSRVTMHPCADTIACMRFALVLFLPLLVNAQLVSPGAIPNGIVPVVFVDGYQFGCTGDSSFSSNFGSADKILQASNLVTVYFDNCAPPSSPGAPMETLGGAFGQFLASLRYVDGSAVRQVDVVAHSMGGLIVRSYLAGKQVTSAGAPAVFNPPLTTGIRKAVFLATPHFGTYLASALGSDTQTQQMSLGSQFLFDLNTWNQGTDDLRGIDALAIAGNGGTGVETTVSGGPSIVGFDDGVVQLSSASIGFAIPGRTRLVPDCHTADSLVVEFSVCRSTTPALNAINDTSNVVGRLIVSFLTGTADWTSPSLSTAIEADKLGSTLGGVMVQAQDPTGLAGAIGSATAGATPLGLNSITSIAYKEVLPANTSLPLSLKLVGSTSASTNVALPAGTSAPIIVKPGPSISGIVPAGIAQFPRSVAPGAFVTVYGTNFLGSVQQQSQPYPDHLGDVQVIVNGTPAPLQFANATQINFVFPNLAPGISKLTVKTSTGQQTVNVMIAPAVPSIFTFTGVANGPAAAENAATYAIVGSNAPLHAGDYVALYLTGIGQTPETTTVTVGGKNCAGQYFFAGHVPSYIGLDQVNCQIPSGVSGAAVPVIVTTNGRPSNTATLPIQ